MLPCRLVVLPCRAPLVTVVPPRVGVGAGQDQRAGGRYRETAAARHGAGIGAAAAAERHRGIVDDVALQARRRAGQRAGRYRRAAGVGVGAGRASACRRWPSAARRCPTWCRHRCRRWPGRRSPRHCSRCCPAGSSCCPAGRLPTPSCPRCSCWCPRGSACRRRSWSACRCPSCCRRRCRPCPGRTRPRHCSGCCPAGWSSCPAATPADTVVPPV